MYKKKSQIHMLETIAVLAIFFILVVLGFVFYVKMFKSGSEGEKEETMQLTAIKIAQRASALPELQCSKNNIARANCIDKLKLDAAEKIMKSPENEIYYYDLLSFSKITVEEIYPEPKNTFVIYERALSDYSDKIVTHIPITIFNPNTDENAFGLMNVTVYLN